MATLFIALAIWFPLSVPVGIRLGKVLHRCSVLIVADNDP